MGAQDGKPTGVLSILQDPVLEQKTKSRFWSKVNKEGPIPHHRPELGPCWEWTAHLIDGYGYFNFNKRFLRVHKVSFVWEYEKEVPDGLTLDHLCSNRKCVRPS